MKKWTKGILTVTAATAVAFGIFALSCKVNKGSANVAFAQENRSASEAAVKIPADALAVTQALQTTFRSISSEVLPAVVEVDVTTTQTVQTYNPFEYFFNFGNGDSGSGTREYESQGLGSGFIVRKTGKTVYVLTNEHVAGDAKKITIRLNDEREFEGTLVGKDERMDIALVSFQCDDPSSITVATLGDSDLVQQGDICLAMGSPLGYFASVTQGIVSATGRSGAQIGSISDFIQTDADINQGNSGGPLINIYGEVIGINSWIASQSGGSQGLGFSIPINNIKTAIDQFISDGKITYGWLGASLADITTDFKKELEVEDVSGSFVSQVFIGSPAMKGGLQAGDYITALNGKTVKDTDQLVRDVGNLRAGQTASFTVRRAKQSVTITVKIDSRNEEVSADNSKLWPGFTISPLTDALRNRLSVEKGVKGVVITSVQEKSPAAALRLQTGDVITAVNGTSVSNVKEFYAALDTQKNSQVYFDVYSDGHTISTARYRIPN